jgi:hypothetical protein
MMDEVEAVIGEVAAKHDVLLGRDDPALVIPTLVQAGVLRAVKDLRVQLGNDEKERKAALQKFVSEIHAQSLKAFEAEAAAIALKVQETVRLDIAKAGVTAAALVANVNHAHSKPMWVRWIGVGLVAAIVLLGIGIVFGRWLK